MMLKKVLAPAAGRILVSEPTLDDFYFKRSIVLLADHNEEGSFGIILNKPMHVGLNEVVDGYRNFNPGVFFGGPVETDTLFFLHTIGRALPGAQKIANGLFLGGDIDMLKEMIILNQVKSSEIRFFLGYSGWSPSQLEMELEKKSWVVAESTAAEMIHSDPDNLWSTIMRNMGSKYAIWSNYPNDPGLN